MKKTNRKLLRVAILIALPLIAGCWDYNETFDNPSSGETMVKLVLTVFLTGYSGDVFPPVAEWWTDTGNGGAPRSAVKVQQLMVGSKWELTWNVMVPPGGSYHVGWKYVLNNTKSEVLWGRYIDDDGDQWQVAVASVTTDNGNLVVANSAEAQIPIVVTQLQWTATNTPLTLDDLRFGDPELEALPWQNVTPAIPFQMPPGSPAHTFDIPEEQIKGMSYGLVRYAASEPGNPLSRSEGVYQSVLPVDGIPAVSAWGMIVLALLVLTGGCLIYLNRRLPIAAP